MEKYVIGRTLGHGQWGVVRKARRKTDGLDVAIKKVRCGGSAEGINFQVLREIKMLQGMRHAHVIELHDVFQNASGDSTLSLVFELMMGDLEQVLYASSAILSDSQKILYAFMLLDALAFLHVHFVLHRDVKPANLLISEAGVLRLTDFGYARAFAEPNAHMSYECCTLWYRPPELLLGADHYSSGVDAWGAGCVLAELCIRRPLFRGETDIDQLAKIFSILGSPKNDTWPGVESLRKFVIFTNTQSEGLDMLLNDSQITPLATSLLALDPNHRASAADSLKSAAFTPVLGRG